MNKKRIVLITGASSGIGLASCRIFHKNGWYVIGVARRSVKRCNYISRYISADLSKHADVKKIVESIYCREKQLDVLINNAACQICKPLIETTLKEWNMAYAVNVQAPFLLAKYLYKFLYKSQGSIINIASIHAVATSLNIAAYASSKGALVALTRNMAIEFAKDDIRVNAVLPGAVDTPMLRDGLKRGHIKGGEEDELVISLGRRHIIGRVGRPKEVGEVIYFLADKDKASFITGQKFVVDGGALAKLSTE